MKPGGIFLISLIGCYSAMAQNQEPLVNSQGWAQQDLSIRGSSYMGAGISINGLNLKAPYSAHFSSELPIPSNLLATQTRTGLDNVSGHLVGTVAYTTLPLQEAAYVSAGIGTSEHYLASLLGTSENIGGFIDWEKAHNIDHDKNGMDRLSGGAVVQFEQNGWLVDILSISQTKRYGAQGYYGIPSNVYAEERVYDDLLLANATRGDLDDAFIRAGATWRLMDNEYKLPTFGFENDVSSKYVAADIEGRTMEIQNVALNLRGDIEHERIGGDLGKDDRTRGSVLFLPELRLERFSATAGLNSVFLSSESAEWLPQAGIDFFLTDNSTLYATYSESVQQPDFQTLLYSDAFHTNNASLQLQRARNTELGFRQFMSASMDGRVAVFYRRMENASDWVKSSATDTAWNATDLGTLDVFGTEAEINYYPSDALALGVFYQWISKDDYDFYAGLYELDYPEHLLNLSGHWDFLPGFQLAATQILRLQTDNKARTGNDFGADASVGLHWLPRFANNVRLSFLVDNLWGTDFQAIPGLKPPSRTVSTSVTVNW